MTSLYDNTYGAAGTFDTANDGGSRAPQPDDWSGIYFWADSQGSIDRARIMYAGGPSAIEGGFAGAFDPIEIHQAKVRMTDTLFENNGGGTDTTGRNGRGNVAPATIYVVGDQPVIAGNTFVDNDGPVIDINLDALTATLVPDWGRQTGVNPNPLAANSTPADRFTQYSDNKGPLVRDNALTGNGINGMLVRGATVDNDLVWDDTDIVYVVESAIYVPNEHTYGTLAWRATTIRAWWSNCWGRRPALRPPAAAGEPHPHRRHAGDSRRARVSRHPHVAERQQRGGRPDARRAAAVGHLQQPQRGAEGGRLGEHHLREDEQRQQRGGRQRVQRGHQPRRGRHDRNGPEPGRPGRQHRRRRRNLPPGLRGPRHGRQREPRATDIYAFQAYPGTEVTFDVNRTSQSLDSVVELLDGNGNLIAWSDNSATEQPADPGLLSDLLPGQGLAYAMGADDWGTDMRDIYSTNPGDAGMRVVLPGATGTTKANCSTTSPCKVRCRSATSRCRWP